MPGTPKTTQRNHRFTQEDDTYIELIMQANCMPERIQAIRLALKREAQRIRPNKLASIVASMEESQKTG